MRPSRCGPRNRRLAQHDARVGTRTVRCRSMAGGDPVVTQLNA
jgi:hypothetical protein